MATENVERYGLTAIAFHWLMFFLVVCVGILGLLHDSWPKETQQFWINIHAVLGLALWFTLFARFWWRRGHKPPPPVETGGLLARRAAGITHAALYVLMFVIPIVGIITFIYHGRIFDFGLFKLDFGIKSNRAVFHPTEDLHGYLAYALFALAGIHAAAALWHQFVLRDGLLARMWPATLRRL
ncbi:MAG TPA: cytochrome b/b6 domain-containing protein [Steroidobacteraceae bacterium]|jgi:cytochrome b561|nr:cytochrome b/b6 domain-containing protein [Steroidobacteraceae bacterium]